MTEDVLQQIDLDDAVLEKATLQKEGIMYKILSDDPTVLNKIYQYIEQAFVISPYTIFFISDTAYSSTLRRYFFSFALKES